MVCAKKVWLLAPEIWLLFKNQTLPMAAEDVSKTEPPGHNKESPVMTGTVGAGLSVTMAGSDVDRQPLVDFKVTVYLPAIFTTAVLKVSPAIKSPFLYHWFFHAGFRLLVDNIALSVGQKFKIPVMVGVGLAGTP